MSFFKKLFGIVDLSNYEEPEEWDVVVVGVTFKNKDGSDRQALLKKSAVGEHITLRRSPMKDYPNAIEVRTFRGQIGNISEDDAAELAPIIDKGAHIKAKIAKLTGGTQEKPNLGCVLDILIYVKK